jgi:hypothetical protein
MITLEMRLLIARKGKKIKKIMARKISEKLVKKLTSGDLEILLKYIKSDPELRLEVRTGGKAFVYYRKGKALEIDLRRFKVDENYVKGTKFLMPDTNLAKTKPKEYFSRMKKIIDNWVDNIKKRPEFDTQQNIARNNQAKDDKYIIIDIEYNFSQAEIKERNREKRAGFDLLGIERKTNKIVFFEVKKGRSALTGKAGLNSHIEDFETYLFGKNKDKFREQLEIDIRNIVSDKKELGIIDFALPSDFSIDDNKIDFMFVFEPTADCSKEQYDLIYEQEITNSRKKISNNFYFTKQLQIMTYKKQQLKKHFIYFKNEKLDGVLIEPSQNNLFLPIRGKAEEYFEKNSIPFWHYDKIENANDKVPSGIIISSQISCLNHLFPLRLDKMSVESIVNLPNAEKIDDGYIAFEFVNQNKKYLDETNETRGTKCTSIDAFVKVNNVGIGIEWKYTETDYDVAKAKEYWKDKPHQKRYMPLLEKSNIQADYNVLVSCQMYYELMRQTLLLEQMTMHGEISDYLNIVVCPKENTELYQCCENWKGYLNDKSKFKLITPQDLLQNIDKEKYKELLNYLQTRYWQ